MIEFQKRLSRGEDPTQKIDMAAGSGAAGFVAAIRRTQHDEVARDHEDESDNEVSIWVISRVSQVESDDGNLKERPLTSHNLYSLPILKGS